MPHSAHKYSGASVYEFNTFLKVVWSPEIFIKQNHFFTPHKRFKGRQQIQAGVGIDGKSDTNWCSLVDIHSLTTDLCCHSSPEMFRIQRIFCKPISLWWEAFVNWASTVPISTKDISFTTRLWVFSISFAGCVVRELASQPYSLGFDPTIWHLGKVSYCSLKPTKALQKDSVGGKWKKPAVYTCACVQLSISLSWNCVSKSLCHTSSVPYQSYAKTHLGRGEIIPGVETSAETGKASGWRNSLTNILHGTMKW